jgi:hypothetical protein
VAKTIRVPRALLDRGPHVQRLLEQLTELRGDVVGARDWLSGQPSDTDNEGAVHTVAQLAELQQRAGEVYRQLLAAHEAHPLSRHTVTRVLAWAIADFADLADQVAVTTAAQSRQWWPVDQDAPEAGDRT